MVNALAYSQITPDIEPLELPEEDVKWCTVSLRDVTDAGMRLEASVFDIEGKYAREVIRNCKYANRPFLGENGFANAYTCGRFKRIWVPYSEFPIYQPSSIMDLKPEIDGYLSHHTNTNIEELKVRYGQILITCSGTIGKTALVRRTLENKIFSHDLIRVDVKETKDIGYLYAFLRSDIGNILLQSNRYGAVITHIEPEHLAGIPVPNPPDLIKNRINDLINRSFELRDTSNELIDKAEALLVKELQLPSIHELKGKYFDEKADVDNYTVKLSSLSGRLDGSYHVPVVNAITGHLKKFAAELTTVGNERISKEIILPGRFKRIYVEEGQGQIFFSGRSIMELDPSDKKYLSFAKHNRRIKDQLTIKHNMILVTCSGTIGKIAFVPKHWDNWAMTHDIIRIIPDTTLSGYLYIWLQTEYANKMIQAMTYGSVVPHIEIAHIKNIPVPLLKNKSIQDEINTLALESNQLRYEAYKAEQQAMRILNNEVILA